MCHEFSSPSDRRDRENKFHRESPGRGSVTSPSSIAKDLHGLVSKRSIQISVQTQLPRGEILILGSYAINRKRNLEVRVLSDLFLKLIGNRPDKDRTRILHFVKPVAVSVEPFLAGFDAIDLYLRILHRINLLDVLVRHLDGSTVQRFIQGRERRNHTGKDIWQRRCGLKFSGQVGKSVSKLISRLISCKMPAGFNQAAIRGYLDSHWGLGQCRQSALICFAVTIEPPSRLADVASAKEFVDSVAIRYAKQGQIAISPDAQAGGAVASEFSATVANPASIEAAGKQQKEYLMKQYDVLANHLEQDHSGTNDKVMELEAHQEASDARLDMMKLELDDDFIKGVEPRLDPTKSRTYDSSWNWVREDLISILTEIHPEDSIPRGLATDDHLRHILNRWDPTCGDVVGFYSSYSNATSHPRLKSIVDVLLHESMRTAGADPTFKYSKPTVSPKTTIDPTGKIECEEIPRI